MPIISDDNFLNWFQTLWVQPWHSILQCILFQMDVLDCRLFFPQLLGEGATKKETWMKGYQRQVQLHFNMKILVLMDSFLICSKHKTNIWGNISNIILTIFTLCLLVIQIIILSSLFYENYMLNYYKFG